MQCLLCVFTFVDEAPAALVVLCASVDDLTRLLINGLCASGAEPDGVIERVFAPYKRDLIADLRALPRFSEPGHA